MHDHLYASVTNRIVAALEQGVAPWVRPWSVGIDTLPMNAASKRPYRGINVVLFELEAQRHGYPRNAWMTFRQASELGGQVLRGRKPHESYSGACARWRRSPTSTQPSTSTICPIASFRSCALSTCSTWPRSTGCLRT